jgi:hypothetical protein
MKINYTVLYKVFFALLGFSAVVTELAILGTHGRVVPAKGYKKNRSTGRFFCF